MTRVERGPEEHRWFPGKYNGYGMPRGPLGTHDVGPTCAIGFCPLCGSNARGTCRSRGSFDCPTCTMFWYDDRVGTQTYSFEDFISPA